VERLADIEKKVGRSGEGAILYSWSTFHRCLPGFLNDDDDDERCFLLLHATLHFVFIHYSKNHKGIKG
jgi:hypothetical protein